MELTLDEAIDAYLTYLRVERGLAAATISAYSTDLRGFARHVDAKRADWAKGANPATDYLAALSRPPRVLKPSAPPAQGSGDPRVLPLQLRRRADRT